MPEPTPTPSRPGRHVRGVLTLVTLALVAGCARPVAPPPLRAPSTEGRDIFLRRCASCHGPDGRGDGPVAASLRTTPTDLTRLGAGNADGFPRERVIAVVTGMEPRAAHGSREMPVWSLRFDPPSGATAAAALWARRQLELLTAHLEAIQATP